MSYCNHSNQSKYPFKLPNLPYQVESFKPHLSAESFVYHHGKHHNTYVTNLNKLIEADQSLASKDLETIILEGSKNNNQAVFNNAAQVWNHTFFWHSIVPHGGGKPAGKMLELIERDFGSYESFVENFRNTALSQFGSGWTWLVYNNGKLEIVKTSNAETPITKSLKPLLACDVWEHAYYIDYRNKRVDYVTVYINDMINWEFALKNLPSS